MDKVAFDFAYMFKYSERPKTLAERRFDDDVPEEIKTRRLNEIIAKQLQHSLTSNRKQIGQVQKILIEGNSKRSEAHLSGRNSQNAVVVFPKEHYQKGDYVFVKIEDCTSATLMGKVVESI
jgi:tRNA-2-methylthio-N6-dimethylallyladenosine synthase